METATNSLDKHLSTGLQFSSRPVRVRLYLLLWLGWGLDAGGSFFNGGGESMQVDIKCPCGATFSVTAAAGYAVANAQLTADRFVAAHRGHGASTCAAEPPQLDPPDSNRSVLLRMTNGQFEYWCVGQYSDGEWRYLSPTGTGYGSCRFVAGHLEVIRWREIPAA